MSPHLDTVGAGSSANSQRANAHIYNVHLLSYSGTIVISGLRSMETMLVLFLH